jgi:hypothetical protein
LLIPGLLQTREYARSLMVDGGASEQVLDVDVAFRMERQGVLTRRRPVRLTAVIGEHAVRHPACDDAVMFGQLRHLLAMGERTNIQIRILPMYQHRYTLGLEGPFMYFEFPLSSPLVYVESFWSTTMLSAANIVRAYRDSIDVILGSTMGADESRDCITRLAQECRATRRPPDVMG